METQILSAKDTGVAGKLLAENKLVAFPTETVYGLGANALNSDAVNHIFKAKGRPNDNPLIAHIADVDDIYKLSDNIPAKARELIDEFWPGPLTIILEKKAGVPDALTAGLNTVAIRMPDHPTALDIIKYAETPIAAPSANLSTKPSPTKAKHVIDDLSGRIDAVVDGGDVEIGIESTVIDLTSDTPTILRPGKITIEDIKEIIGDVTAKSKEGDIARSPGMKYKHYSPEAKVILAPKEKFDEIKEKHSNKKIGEIIVEKNLEDYAQNIFSEFRKMDNEGVDIILVESVAEEGLGVGIMNRLRKAASEIIQTN